MGNSSPFTSRRLLSRLSEKGEVRVWLARAEVPPPGPGQVTVRLEAAPLHSSDMNKMLGPVIIDQAVQSGTADEPELTVPLQPSALPFYKLQIGKTVAAGSEGAGTVIVTGEGAAHLMGKRVAVWKSSTFCDYQNVAAADCLVLPDDVTTEDGAAAFINPLTALGIVETVRRHGYKAMINTAAASNVGRMLVGICREDGIGLVSVVRRPAAVAELRDLGAEFVVDSSSDQFEESLVDAIDATGAMVCFDAVGGKLSGKILAGIEACAQRHVTEFSYTGSLQPRHCYIYGALDSSPIEIPRSAGLSWVCTGWMFPAFLAGLSPAELQKLFARIQAGLATTFRSRFSQRIGLADVLRIEVAGRYLQRSAAGSTLITF